MATEIVYVRRIVRITVTMVDGEKRVFSAEKNEFLLCPVCNGGAISVDKYDATTGDFQLAKVIAHGQWKEVDAETDMIKIEVENGKITQGKQAITRTN